MATAAGGRWNWLDECCDGAGGVGLHAGEHVLVGLDGEHGAGVSEPFGHDLGGDSGGDEQGAVGVAEVVEADDRQAGATGDAFERLADGMGMDWPSGGGREHPSGVLDADGGELGGLQGTPAVEDSKGRAVEVDTAAGVVGLPA